MVSSRWDDDEAARWTGDLGQRVYTSRLLGRDPDLVLHGGGNTSVKSRRTTVFGEEVDVLLVKGSGADLADIDESGFACLRLADVARLAQLDALSDTDMAEQLLVASLTAGGPAPSVEAILHAILPSKFVDHTHADAVVTLTNCESAAEALGRVYGDEVVVVPYVMPGFLLARECARILPAALDRPGVVGVVLMNHGIFTWGDTARESYETMIDLVRRADADVDRHRDPAAGPAPGGRRPHRPGRAPPPGVRGRGGTVRDVEPHRRAADGASSPAPTWPTSPSGDRSRPTTSSAPSPSPLVGRDVDGFVAAYRRYFDEHQRPGPAPAPAPRPRPPGHPRSRAGAGAAPAARPATRPSWRTSTATR